MKRIVIFCPYPCGEAPSQRFRFEQYLSALRLKGFKVTLLPFFNKWTWQKLYKKNSLLPILFSTWIHCLYRVIVSFQAIRADYVFIHREILPVGPPVLEWFIAKIFRKKIIYDFDDAIWMTDKKQESPLARIIRWRGKVASICLWSYKVSCGNEYLATYARQFNKRVILNPTTIDTEIFHDLPDHKITLPNSQGGSSGVTNKSSVIVGWTGSHSTLKYLEMISSTLRILEDKYPQLSFVVIADKTPELSLQRLRFIKWSKESEVNDLATIDIGIMPLPDDDWTKGKCGFKALQYMALMIPAVVSPVAVNRVIVKDEENGFWCSSNQEWIEKLSLLIENDVLRKEMGRKGRALVEQYYSVKSNTTNFINLFS